MSPLSCGMVPVYAPPRERKGAICRPVGNMGQKNPVPKAKRPGNPRLALGEAPARSSRWLLESKKTGGERYPRLLACCVCTMLIRLFYSSAALDSLLTSLEAELSLLSTALLVSELLSSLAEDSVSEAEEAPLRVLSLTKEESFTVFMAD